MTGATMYLVLPLNRPQYVQAPEALITALARDLFEVEGEAPSGRKKPAVMYSTEEPDSSTLVTLSTYPDKDRFETFQEKLPLKPYQVKDRELLTRATAASLLGIRTRKGKQQPASPMSVNLALLQNAQGFQRAANPPNYGLILRQLHALGGGRSHEDPAKRWVAAVSHRLRLDPTLRAIDAAARDALLLGSVREALRPDAPVPASLQNTPYTWFRNAWNLLTDEQWVAALPARTWTDWATTVLRLVMGMGYLWEVAWYESLARAIVEGSPMSVEQVRQRMPEILPWRPMDLSNSVRDVTSLLYQRTRRGAELRMALGVSLEKHPDIAAGPVSEIPIELLVDEDLKQRLRSILQLGAWTGKGNLWEAIRYSLVTRDESGPFADHYGLLRTRGRSALVVEPGIEWAALVASLACGSPGAIRDVAAVLRSLRALGVSPETRDLISLLEKAGLTRGSADADSGLEVHSAY